MDQDITGLLLAWRAGDKEAPGRLFTLVYDDLHRMAHRQISSGRGDRTLNTTAVVHEAYLRLVDQSRAEWADRGHFLAVASRVMRHVLIDYARRHRAAKRGGGIDRVHLDETAMATRGQAATLIALDEALDRLGA